MRRVCVTGQGEQNISDSHRPLRRNVRGKPSFYAAWRFDLSQFALGLSPGEANRAKPTMRTAVSEMMPLNGLAFHLFVRKRTLWRTQMIMAINVPLDVRRDPQQIAASTSR